MGDDGAMPAVAERALAPSVDTEKPAELPLSPTEVEQMRRHLAFMREFRSALRLKLSAKEDLLVNGSKSPEHRGTCKYLLGKVDRTAIVSAVDREPLKSDAPSRLRFLAGAAAITGNVGVLLRFLETLAAGGDSQRAARAFAPTVSTIDFSELSAARLGRLLEVIGQAFGVADRPGVLFGLLQSASFRRAFDAHVSELEPELVGRFAPLRAVFDALQATSPKRGDRRTPALEATPELAAGLRAVFASPEALTGYPRPLREGLVTAALALSDDWPLAHPGLQTLLGSLPADAKGFRAIAQICTFRFLDAERFDDAAAVLNRLCKAQSGLKEAEALAVELGKPRLPPFAFEALPPKGEALGLTAAYWLPKRQSVLVRLGEKSEAEQTAAEAELQRGLCLPGVADVMTNGRLPDGRPYVTVASLPRLDRVLGEAAQPLELSDALELALAGVRILRALGLAGVFLPDAAAYRFGVAAPRPQNGLVLADLRGAEACEPADAERALAPVAVSWCVDVLSFPPFSGRKLRRELPSALAEALKVGRDDPPLPRDLARLLARR